MWLPFVFLLYALFALVFVISKFGLAYTTPLFFVGSRMMVAGILMIVYLLIFKRESFKLSRQNLTAFFALGLFNIYLTNACEFWGLRHLTSAKCCFFYSLSPFLSALFAYFVLSEKMSFKKWLGLGVGFLGLYPMLLVQTSGEELTRSFAFISWAEIAVLGAVVFSVYGWILLKKICVDQKQSPLIANGFSMFIGGFLAMVNSYIVEDWNPVPVVEWVPFICSSICLILISSLICYNLYGFLLRHYSATFMSFAGFTTPIFTALFGWLLLGETTTWHLYLSLSILLSGLYIFHMDEFKKTAPQSAETSVLLRE